MTKRGILDYDEYIGDGVYAGYDGHGVWLCTEREGQGLVEICLEPRAVLNVMEYLQRKRFIKETPK